MTAVSQRGYVRHGLSGQITSPKKRVLMKNFDSRTYSINDFVEWDKQNTLILNASFQRRAIWSDDAKSYLMDTIIRGKPIPKVFIRQKINASTKTSIRDVVDGQQRLRTILAYVQDGFTIAKKHNEVFGGKYFSELDEVVQTDILAFEVAVDLLINLPDSEILDIFNRLNSYAFVLNEQERINSNHFGQFKILADEISRKHYDYWLNQKIISNNKILRMDDVNLVADLLISLIEGIKAKRQIKTYYTTYEKKFNADSAELSAQFDAIISMIGRLFPEGLANHYYRRANIFYSLFTAVAHSLYGIKGLNTKKAKLNTSTEIQRARAGLDRIAEVIEAEDIKTLTDSQRDFKKDIRLATTDQTVRERRAKFLLSLMA